MFHVKHFTLMRKILKRKGEYGIIYARTLSFSDLYHIYGIIVQEQLLRSIVEEIAVGAPPLFLLRGNTILRICSLICDMI